MSIIATNIVAYMAIVALLGLAGVIIWAVLSALRISREVKAYGSLVERPKRTVLETAKSVQGIAEKSKLRALAMAGHGKSAVGSVQRVRDDLVEISSSVDFQAVVDGARETAEGLRGASQSANLVREIFETLRRAEPKEAP